MFKTLASNPKTSVAGLVFFGAYAIAVLGKIWLPEYSEQFDKTRHALQSLAVLYGFYAAKDGKPTVPEDKTQPPKP